MTSLIYLLLSVTIAIPFVVEVVHGSTQQKVASTTTTPTTTGTVNNRPVVGVLAQASDPDLMKYGNEYVISTYVKFLEMAGASVVVVKGAQPYAYYLKLFSQINGLVFPGGHVDLVTSPIGRSARILYHLALNANDNGDPFPILGICQGFEMLTVLTAKKNMLQPTDAENMSLPLHLLPSYKQSRLLGNATKDIIGYLSNENITANFHNMCLPIDTYKNYSSLNQFYRVLSTNKGRKGKEFVSTMEAFKYPFYGLQWHPEKNIFSIRPDQDVSHSSHAVRASQYLAGFFVNEARKNFHGFSSEYERSHLVVENDKRVFIPKDYVEDFFYNVKTKH